MSDRKIIWSYGGGTQSIAIAVLIVEERLPMPERIVMADTGREASETWEYLEKVVRPELGLNVEVASHDLSTVDLYGHNGDILLPMYTKTGRLRTLCSVEWKRRVVRRYLRAHGYGPHNPVLLWLGISMDEIRRAKDSGIKWMEHHWPLMLDVPLSRKDCYELVAKRGLPTPPQSSCWMCPHRMNPQWRRLRDHYPEDFQAAIDLEKQVREKDDGLYLHYLSRIELDKTDLGEDQAELFDDGCEGGYCFV